MQDSVKLKAQKQQADLTQALKSLKEAINLPPTRIHKDATIQRFEFCFELAWKLMQTVTQETTRMEYGPRASIRGAAEMGLINKPEMWIDMLNARNATTHLYKETMTDEVYEKANKFPELASELLSAVGSYL